MAVCGPFSISLCVHSRLRSPSMLALFEARRTNQESLEVVDNLWDKLGLAGSFTGDDLPSFAMFLTVFGRLFMEKQADSQTCRRRLQLTASRRFSVPSPGTIINRAQGPRGHVTQRVFNIRVFLQCSTYWSVHLLTPAPTPHPIRWSPQDP